MRVEHTGDGVTRRPTVLKTVAVTGLHALPQLTIHTLAASAASRSCVLHSGRGNRSLPARKSLSVRYQERERAGTSFATAAEAALFCDAFRTAEAVRFHVGLSAAGFPRRSTSRAFSPCGFRGWLYPALPRRASKRPRRTGQHATGDAAVCVLGNQGGFEC